MKYILFAFMGLISSTVLLAQGLPKPGCTTILADAMFSEVDTTKPRGVADNYHTWENGKELLVKFMPGGGKLLREKVMRSAKEWEKYANIRFRFVPDNDPNAVIRVQLGKGHGHNSAVGTEAKFRSKDEQTINFDTIYLSDITYYISRLQKKGNSGPYNVGNIEDEMAIEPDHWSEKELRRVVVHEFGHALGLLHEQSFPGAINWNKSDSVYNYYQETQGWDRDKVDFNVFEVADQFYTNGTTYDPRSIMHYSVESWQTTDGYSLKDNYELSAGDKALIAALYPKGQKEALKLVPKVEISNFNKLTVTTQTARKGLVIEPVFDLKTNSRLGEVYFVARLATEDGYYVRTSGLYYNWGGTVATYKKMTLLPNSKVSYNKAKKNFELFLPFEYIPDLKGKKVIVEFSVYLDDASNNQYNKLMYYSATNPLSLPQQ